MTSNAFYKLERSKRRYFSTIRYIERIKQSGKIKRLTRSQINALKYRLGQCLAIIRKHLKLAALATGICAIHSVDLDAQCRMNRLPISNQSSFATTIKNTSPAFADIDRDGDLDLVVGYYTGVVNTYLNDQGTFKKAYGALNPFGGIDSYVTEPAFVDIDNDGDPDAFIGTYAAINFFRNDNGIFNEVTGPNNPLNNLALTSRLVPTFVDIDNDGDPDAFIGDSYGTIHFYRNDNGTFNQVTGNANPFNGLDIGSAASPTFVDIDNDGDPDAFIGKSDGMIDFFRNDNGSFNEITGPGNPLNGKDVGFGATPIFVDIDNDSDPDAFIGESEHRIHFFKNNNGTFVEVINSDNPLNTVDVGSNSAVCISDLDDDGDDDAFIGNFTGEIRSFINTNGIYVEIIGTNNPFNGIDVGENSSPILLDTDPTDSDDDQDLIVGGRDGKISYYRNTNGSFAKLTSTNPFNTVDVGFNAAPTFVDFDADNDKDAFVGADDGTIHYYRNDSGTFNEQLGADNPFNGIDVGDRASPSFFLFSRSQALVGNSDGKIIEFKKDGNKYVPVTDSAFEGVDVGFNATPFITSTGSALEVIIGNSSGRVLIYRDEGGRSNVWQGPFTSHWHGPSTNWELNTIPKLGCDEVHVFEGSVLEIDPTQMAEGRTLTILKGGQFEVTLGAELIIDPN